MGVYRPQKKRFGLLPVVRASKRVRACYVRFHGLSCELNCAGFVGSVLVYAEWRIASKGRFVSDSVI